MGVDVYRKMRADAFLEKVFQMRRGVYRAGEPSDAKPVWLVTVLGLVQKYADAGHKFVYGDDLEQEYLQAYRSYSKQPPSPLYIPYFYLSFSEFYEIVWYDDACQISPGDRVSPRLIKERVAYTCLSADAQDIVSDKETAEYVRTRITARYFPAALAEAEAPVAQISEQQFYLSPVGEKTYHTTMATRYSDIVRLRGGKPAYNIEEEKGDEWETFIPNEQFNGVLKTVLSAVRGNNIDMHKSFWINGTYGTGKSHASAVIAHLLSEPVEDIRRWVEMEYRDDKFEELRQRIYKVREQKRLLPVKIYGLRGMSSASDLGLVFQMEITAELRRRGISVAVPTDFETMANYIGSNANMFQVFIDECPAISSFAPTTKKLISLLRGQDISVFDKVREALRESGTSIILPNDNLNDWLVEVQNAVAEKSEYNGLLILWDEFTDVMAQFGVAVLKEMQGVAEKFMNEENNSFICLVSHPSAFNNISNDEQKQTDGRYHRMKYNMEPVSAFKIMSRKFEVVDEELFQNRRNGFYGQNPGLLAYYTRQATDVEATMKDLTNLFPLHPGTANLATHYATAIGSSSRSVFEFLGQNEAISRFLDDENAYARRLTITADYLWDFVLKVFQDDIVNYGAVTERFNSYRERIANRGEAYMAIFKGVLLLNAFNNMSGENNLGLVIPSEENIKKLFAGTQYADQVDEVLYYFNEDGVIQRAPGDDALYSVQFTALPSQEIEAKKEELRHSQFRFTSQVIEFGETAKTCVEKRLAVKFIRPFSYKFYSDEGNESSVAARIKNGKRGAKPSDIFMALLAGQNHDELSKLKSFAERKSAEASTDKDLANIFFVVFDEVLTDKVYQRFIEYQANFACASAHGFSDQMVSHSKHASDLVSDYMTRLQRGNATVYVNGRSFPISVKKFSSSFNDTISASVFSLAPEVVTILRDKAPQTFWANKNSKEIVRRVLFATKKDDIWDGMAQVSPIRYLFQDAIDDQMQWKSTVSATHPLKAVYDFVDKKIKYADKTNTFSFVEKFDELTRPPYGLFSNFAAMAAMAFALKPWVNKVFDQMGKPRDANNLVEDISGLFRAWETGKPSAKLTFKFQTPEEGKLCKALSGIFGLKTAASGYVDISSLKDARYAITGQFIEKKGYPLWAVKYASENALAMIPGGEKITADISTLIDNIVKICADRELRNPALVNETLTLISENKVEVGNLLKNDYVFKNGFHHFLRRVEKVNLQKEEIEDAKTYIGGHLESTVGYWTEEEVTAKLKDWRLEQQPQPAPVVPVHTYPGPDSTAETARQAQAAYIPTTPDELEEKRTRAKARVEGLTSLEEAKRMLVRLCERTNNSWLLDQINI